MLFRARFAFASPFQGGVVVASHQSHGQTDGGTGLFPAGTQVAGHALGFQPDGVTALDVAENVMADAERQECAGAADRVTLACAREEASATSRRLMFLPRDMPVQLKVTANPEPGLRGIGVSTAGTGEQAIERGGSIRLLDQPTLDPSHLVSALQPVAESLREVERGLRVAPFQLLCLSRRFHLFASAILDRLEHDEALELPHQEASIDDFLGNGRGPAKGLGRALWKWGDGATIDGGINGLAMGVIPFLTRLAGRAQSGYLFHYAFAMVVGIALLITWMTLSGGAE